ncbi:MAG: kynureninase [Chloroflexota bacterium]
MTSIGPATDGAARRDDRPDLADARARDAADPLSALRDRFLIPTTADGTPAIYLAGQSLGLQPRTARAAIELELDTWARLGVDAWFDPERPWFTLDSTLREPMARVVGARPDEIGLMHSLTVNVHLLLTSFYRPAGRRSKILTDGPLFPSDRHALMSHLVARGLDPDRELIIVAPRTGEAILRTEDIEAAIADHHDQLALVFLDGVNFATGQAFDIGRLTAAGHEAGAIVGWDLAHAAGNVELTLHDDDVDFAAWCTYKYLNCGPGAVGSIFVHARHAHDPRRPRLSGWWGIDPDHRFDPVAPFVPASGAAGWATSTPSILALAPVAASLAIFGEIGMPALRARSVALTGYLERLLDGLQVDVITPREPPARGAQLSLRFPDAGSVIEGLAAHSVVADYRAPDIIRVAPVPLYNTFEDAWRLADVLRQVADPG